MDWQKPEKKICFQFGQRLFVYDYPLIKIVGSLKIFLNYSYVF